MKADTPTKIHSQLSVSKGVPEGDTGAVKRKTLSLNVTVSEASVCKCYNLLTCLNANTKSQIFLNSYHKADIN